MDTTTLQRLEPLPSVIHDELDTSAQEVLPNTTASTFVLEITTNTLAILDRVLERILRLSIQSPSPIILSHDVTLKSEVPVSEEVIPGLVYDVQMNVQFLKPHQNSSHHGPWLKSVESEIQAFYTTVFRERLLHSKFNVRTGSVTDYLVLYPYVSAFRVALASSDDLRRSYGAIYIQNARRPLTEEEKESHLLSFDFLETTLFILTPEDIGSDYARWWPPASPSDPHKIEIRLSLWNALHRTRHPSLILQFFVCLAHELGHGYRHYVRTLVRPGRRGSTDTLRECAVGDQHKIEGGVAKGESGYVVEHMWLGGTLMCLVERHDEDPWRGDWEKQWSYFKELHILDEEANEGKESEEEWITRRIDNEEVKRFVECSMNKQDPGKLRLGAEVPHQPQYFRTRSRTSRKSKSSRSDPIDWNKYMLVDAVRCGHSSCRKGV